MSVDSEVWGEGEFFLGLDKIHRLTGNYDSQLHTDLTTGAVLELTLNTVFRYWKYASTYKLTVSGYSGTAGDSLAFHNGMKFSTYDQDNDASGVNCAVTYKGAGGTLTATDQTSMASTSTRSSPVMLTE